MPFVFRIREQLLYKGANHEVSASARISIRQQSPSFPRHILREYIHAREEREMFTHKNSSRRGKNKLDSTQNERVERGKTKKKRQMSFRVTMGNLIKDTLVPFIYYLKKRKWH